MIPFTNPWVLLGGVSGLALACALSFGLGHHQKTLEDASAALAGAKATVVKVSAQSAVVASVDQKFAAKAGQIQTNTITLIQKVPTYVTRKADDQCIVSNGAVQLLDAAALDTVPAAPISLPDADSGVGLSDIVQADIINAGSYRQAVNKGDAWDDWYDGLNPDWKKAHPAPTNP